MATIIKRKSKYSVVYYYTDEKGEKHQKWETCQDYNEAKRRKAEIESQLFNGTFIPPQELTVKDFLADFVSVYGRAHWALSTFEANVAIISNYINPTIGNELVQCITPKFVDAYYVRLQSVECVSRKNRIAKTKYLTPATIHSIHIITLVQCFTNHIGSPNLSFFIFYFRFRCFWEWISTNDFPFYGLFKSTS